MKKLLLFISMTNFAYAQYFSNNDIEKRCDDIGENGASVVFKRDLNLPNDLLTTANEEELYRALISTPYKKMETAPWYLYNSSQLKGKKAGFRLQEYLISNLVQKYNERAENESIRDHLQRILKYGADFDVSFSNKDEEYFDSILSRLKRIGSFESKFQQLKENANLVCLPYMAHDCADAVVDAYTHVDPMILRQKYMTTTSFKPILKDVYFNEQYQKALSKIALLMYKKLALASESKIVSGDWYDDMLKIFQEVFNSDAANAQDKLMKYIALYSARGASILDHNLFFHKNSYPMLVAIHIISGAVQVLDYYKQNISNESYAYPSTIKMNCNFGRAYHFWMGAYLGYYLKKQGYSDRTSVIIPHLLGYLYEYAAVVVGKNNNQVFFSDLHSLYNSSLRLSVAQNDIGAKWAVNQNNLIGPYIHFNNWAKKHFNKAKKIKYEDVEEYSERLKEDQVFHFFEWRKVVAPDANYFRLHLIDDV